MPETILNAVMDCGRVSEDMKHYWVRKKVNGDLEMKSGEIISEGQGYDTVKCDEIPCGYFFVAKNNLSLSPDDAIKRYSIFIERNLADKQKILDVAKKAMDEIKLDGYRLNELVSDLAREGE